jgi:methionyl-tRNA formyltransferase
MTLSVVFAGTPDIGLPSLKALIDNGYHVKAVYTQPDRPSGRGQRVVYSPIKQFALTHLIPVYQPIDFKSKEALDALRVLAPDVMVVIAYGLILPQTVLSIPTYGCINVHASLLPLYRGASPISAAILNGDIKTGVTIMKMDKGMDTGDILALSSLDIHLDDTTASLWHRLSDCAVRPLLAVLSKLKTGIEAIPQHHEQATYAPKIAKIDAQINWLNAANLIERAIRAYQPFPIAYSFLNGDMVKIHQAKVVIDDAPKTTNPGTILSVDKLGMLVSTGNGLLRIEVLQFPSKKALSVSTWLNGVDVNQYIGKVFSNDPR